MVAVLLTGAGNETSAVLASTGTTVTVTKPSAVADGDLLIAWGMNRNQTTAMTATGWTSVAPTGGDITNSGIPRLMWLKVPTASAVAASWVFTGGASGRMAVRVHRVTGADLSAADPVDVIGAEVLSGATLLTVPGVTTTSTNELILAGLLTHVSSGQAQVWGFTSTAMTVTSKVVTGPTTASTSAIQLATVAQAAAGDTGSKDFTIEGTVANGYGYLIAVKSAATSTTYAISSSTDATSTTSSALTRVAQVFAIAATTAALSASSADVSRVPQVLPITSTTAATSGTSGTVTGLLQVASTTTATSGTASTFTSLLLVGSTTAATSSSSAALTSVLPITSTTPATSGVAAAFTIAVKTLGISSTTAATSATSAALTVIPGSVTYSIASTTATTSATSADLTRVLRVLAVASTTAAATSTGTTLTAILRVSSTTAATSGTAAALTAILGIDSTTSAVSGTSASLRRAPSAPSPTPPGRTLVAAAQDRTSRIAAEDRTLRVPADLRTLIA